MYERYGKRILDIVISCFALVLLSPLFLGLWALVRFKLGSPVIFCQLRPGKDGQIFKLYKFRSMTDTKDKAGNLLPDNIRLTSFGRKLRSTSLDELPELVNVLKGNMSLIGPRPLLVEYLPLYNEFQKHRHDVKPGLTGQAQINGRNGISWEEKFKYDIEYVRNITLKNDLCIMLKTISIVLGRKGIHSAASATVEKFNGGKGENESDAL